MPVARETISAMSSGVTSGARWRPLRRSSSSPLARLDLVLELAGAVVVLGRGRLVALAREPAQLLLERPGVVVLRLRRAGGRARSPGRSGRSPCRAGSGRGCSGRRARRRRRSPRRRSGRGGTPRSGPSGRGGSRSSRRRSARGRSTGWKRRSSAGSFSMFLRYSSSVVAPITWSSPRASAGLSMFEASIEPSAAPAPTTVCSSSMKRIRSSARPDLVDHRLQPLLELAAVLRAGDHPGEVERDDAVARRASRAPRR